MSETPAEIRGWLFDIYHLDSPMVLWIRDEQGVFHRLEDQFRPKFYAQGRREVLNSLIHFLCSTRYITGYRPVGKKEFWSGKVIDVMEIEVSSATNYSKLPVVLARWEEKIKFYNCDIPPTQLYLYEKGLSPTDRCVVKTEGNRILSIFPESPGSVWTEDLPFPPLKILDLSDQGASADLFQRHCISLECEGYRIEMDRIDLEEIRKFIERFDPDVILSNGGDEYLFPTLFSLERKYKFPIPWDREPCPGKRALNLRGYSYFSYGRTYYRAPAHVFLGRWHIDRRNSFLYAESGMDGIMELSRLAKIPVQRMARTSPGTAITSMQLDRAFRDGILIPWRKSEPEKFKTAWDLLVSDKGGLVFQPKLGIFEEVAEIDYASMYPTIMAIHNISPETVLCQCCENSAVPEVGYTICERKEGIVPQTLKPLLARRNWLKRMAKEAVTSFPSDEGKEIKVKSYEQRQTAIKWALVTCFGYLGYRNAKFGRIEAHEAVTAFGRDKLLKAKEICEEAGFEILHAITDSLWIRKDGLTEEEIHQLCRKIGESTQVNMNLEGIYYWIVFLPSKENAEVPVANRYFGLFRNGKIKARGLAFRRGDTPPLVREAQLRMLDIVAGAKNISDYRSRIPEIVELLAEYGLLLKQGLARTEKLLIERTITREPNTYRVESPLAIASQQLDDFGIIVHPGQRIKYLIKDSRSCEKGEKVKAFPLVGPDDTYDVDKYLEMLFKAGEELLIHLGYDREAIKRMVNEYL